VLLFRDKKEISALNGKVDNEIISIDSVAKFCDGAKNFLSSTKHPSLANIS
jgi:hypothetical protein